MNSKQYIDDAHKTLSPQFHGEMVTMQQFVNTLSFAIEALQQLDAIKKALFYGRQNDILIMPTDVTMTCAELLNGTPPEQANLIHAIIGKATECGELLEALFSSYEKNKVLDHVNLIEEIGDGLWYDAILLRAIEGDFETAMSINILKLQKRFPNKFTEEAANVRDLFAEREVLEGKSSLRDIKNFDEEKFFTEETNKLIENLNKPEERDEMQQYGTTGKEH